MRKLFILSLLLAAIPVSAAFYSTENLTVDATAGGVPFTATKITVAGQPPMTYADCTLRTAEIAYLWVDPAQTTLTATNGKLLEVGQQLIFQARQEMLNFRAIRTTGTSGVLDCIYKAP